MTTITRYTRQFVRYLRNNKAVSALEYAILIGIIAVAVTAALVTFGGDVTTAIEAVGDKVETGGANVGQIGPAAAPSPPN